MHSVIKFAVAAPLLFVAVSSMAQSKLNCHIDPISGLPEATLDWQNTLGRDRADSWCRRYLMAEQVQAADTASQVAEYVSLQGHASGAELHRVPAAEPQPVAPQQFDMGAATPADYIQIKSRR
jgi:hypothetical protein